MFKSMCEIKPTDKMDKLRAVTLVSICSCFVVIVVAVIIGVLV